MIVLGFADYRAPAQRLAEALQCPVAQVEVHRFPDGEHKVTLPSTLPDHVIFCRSLFHPNDKLIDLLFAARTARELGVNRLSLVAPYLCYMRQDTAFEAGEAVSQRIIGRWLAELFDDVVTVDPHLHRTASLDVVMPGIHAIALSAGVPMADYLRRRQGMDDAILLGPDEESRQWVSSIAGLAGLEFGVATKQRMGDRSVCIQLPDIDFAGRPVVLLDDMVSTGRTLVEAAVQLQQAKASSITCLVTHALLHEAAEKQMQQAGIGLLVTSDSVPHASNAIELASSLAEPFRAEKTG